MKTQKWILIGSVIVFLGAAALAAFTFLTPFAWAQGPMGWNGRGNGSMFDQGFGPGGGMGRGMMFNGDFGSRFGMGPGGGPGMMGNMGGRWGGPENSMIAIVAEKLGLTTDELVTELQAGKTIADIAKEKNVALETIVDAVVAPRAERLTQMVTNGRLTQEQADTMLATMKANITTKMSEKWEPRGLGYQDADGDGACDNMGQGPMGGRFGGGRMGGRWGGNPVITTAAEKLGLTQAELFTELRAGKSIAQVAQEKNVELGTIVGAIIAPRAERLNKLVTAGQLTQEQVDNRLSNLRVDMIDWLNQNWTSQNTTPNADTTQPETY